MIIYSYSTAYKEKEKNIIHNYVVLLIVYMKKNFNPGNNTKWPAS